MGHWAERPAIVETLSSETVLTFENGFVFYYSTESAEVKTMRSIGHCQKNRHYYPMYAHSKTLILLDKKRCPLENTRWQPPEQMETLQTMTVRIPK